MAKRLLTECPYCHRKVSIFGANVLKTKGEHCCKGCKCISNVVIHTGLYAIGTVSVVTSFAIMLLYSLLGDHSDYRGILYVFAPFLVFYIAVPFFVKLEPCVDKSAVNKLKRKISPIPEVKPEVVQDNPIELDVGDDFRQSFAIAKSMSKPAGEEEAEKAQFSADSEENIQSGLDMDISADVGNEEAGSEENVKINNKPEKTEEKVAEEPSSPAKEENDDDGSVSFIIGRK